MRTNLILILYDTYRFRITWDFNSISDSFSKKKISLHCKNCLTKMKNFTNRTNIVTLYSCCCMLMENQGHKCHLLQVFVFCKLSWVSEDERFFFSHPYPYHSTSFMKGLPCFLFASIPFPLSIHLFFSGITICKSCGRGGSSVFPQNQMAFFKEIIKLLSQQYNWVLHKLKFQNTMLSEKVFQFDSKVRTNIKINFISLSLHTPQL